MSNIFRLREHPTSHDRLLDRGEGCSFLRDSVIAWMHDHTPSGELIEEYSDEFEFDLAIRFDSESDLVAFVLRWC